MRTYMHVYVPGIMYVCTNVCMQRFLCSSSHPSANIVVVGGGVVPADKHLVFSVRYRNGPP